MEITRPQHPTLLRMSKRLRPFAVPFLTFAGCWFVSLIIHNPVPRIHDEFSYFLMGETFARGHVANASPPLPEFFDTFHVLVRPAYASKYFPVQGIFLALGEKLAGHPAIGVWLSSALACAALVWMLQAWISPGWALLGGFIVVVQYGMYSYWSQTYWGGMATALGGALFFGALRRLWDRLSWQHSIWLALGLVILANSRPLEGALAALPGTVLFSYHIAKNRRWHEHGFWPKVVLPCFSVLALGALATGSYNRAITGSALKPPYVLHEQQYQETPPFIFLPKRSELTYSSVWLRYYYEFQELHLYDSQRIPKLWVLAVARKIATWWDMSIALPGLRVVGTKVSTGNPHFVIFVENFPDGWQRQAALIGTQPQFPQGTNVEYVVVRVANERGANEIEIRLFERGVGETESSGTGSCAAAIAAIASGRVASPVTVIAPGGAQTVRWENQVYLRGPATLICQGEFFV